MIAPIIQKIVSQKEIEMCFNIRAKVFIEGQGIPSDMEVDGLDAVSEHWLVQIESQPVGTARVRFIEDTAKIERVSVLETHQGLGLGKLLMQAILMDLKNNLLVRIAKLSAQLYAIPFYEKLGFIVCSGEYLDAGMPHKDMELILGVSVSFKKSDNTR
jgi:predicted GNAT family N-acyltransferase